MSQHPPVDIAVRWARVRAELARSGINMSAALDCDELNRRSQISDIPRHGRLLLFGAGGTQFWRQLKAASREGKSAAADTSGHAVDNFSQDAVMTAVSVHLGGFKTRQLYPGDTSIMLSALGEYLGWSFQSPLGLGINADYGLWFAYRALVWSDAPIKADPPDVGNDKSQSTSPCQACVDQPCVSACPAAAVSADQPFDLAACVGFRLQPRSDCADRCFARLACPVAAESRQSLEQHKYHQRHSLAALATWYGGREDEC